MSSENGASVVPLDFDRPDRASRPKGKTIEDRFAAASFLIRSRPVAAAAKWTREKLSVRWLC